MKLLLQHRILFGYIILTAVIGSMAATMLRERSRVHKIEEEITEIREANQTINASPIDTLRLVLKNKEKHLFNTMHAFQWQDSFLQEQEPAIAEQTKKTSAL